MGDAQAELLAMPESESQTKLTRWTPEQAHEVGLPSVEAINLITKYAEKLEGSVFIPKGVGTLPNAVGIIMAGREMGFAPMESLRNLKVGPGGDILMRYTGMLAMMRRHGFKPDFPTEPTEERCIFEVTRPDTGKKRCITWKIEQAKKAGLIKQGSGWEKYPIDHLVARCVSQMFRQECSHLSGGAVYDPTELEPESQEERITRAAGKNQTPVDESLIPAELESALRNAAHNAGRVQGCALAKLAEIQGTIKAKLEIEKADIRDGYVQAGVRDMAKALVEEAIAELQAEPPRRCGRPSRPSAIEQAQAGVVAQSLSPVEEGMASGQTIAPQTGHATVADVTAAQFAAHRPAELVEKLLPQKGPEKPKGDFPDLFS